MAEVHQQATRENVLTNTCHSKVCAESNISICSQRVFKCLPPLVFDKVSSHRQEKGIESQLDLRESNPFYICRWSLLPLTEPEITPLCPTQGTRQALIQHFINRISLVLHFTVPLLSFSVLKSAVFILPFYWLPGPDPPNWPRGGQDWEQCASLCSGNKSYPLLSRCMDQEKRLQTAFQLITQVSAFLRKKFQQFYVAFISVSC